MIYPKTTAEPVVKMGRLAELSSVIRLYSETLHVVMDNRRAKGQTMNRTQKLITHPIEPMEAPPYFWANMPLPIPSINNEQPIIPINLSLVAHIEVNMEPIIKTIAITPFNIFT